MAKIRLINSKREPVTEFTREGFDKEEIDLIEYTNKFGKQNFFIFVDETEDGVLVYRAIRSVARVKEMKET